MRLNPARVQAQTPDQLVAGIDGLLAAAGPLDRLALCCVSLDASTPDENVRAILEAARRQPNGWLGR